MHTERIIYNEDISIGRRRSFDGHRMAAETGRIPCLDD